MELRSGAMAINLKEYSKRGWKWDLENLSGRMDGTMTDSSSKTIYTARAR